MVELVGVPTIVTAVGVVMEVLKRAINKELFNTLIPIFSSLLGVGFAVVLYYFMPGYIPADNVFIAVILGAVSGWGATGFNQVFKQLTKKEDKNNENK